MCHAFLITCPPPFACCDVTHGIEQGHGGMNLPQKLVVSLLLFQHSCAGIPSICITWTPRILPYSSPGLVSNGTEKGKRLHQLPSCLRYGTDKTGHVPSAAQRHAGMWLNSTPGSVFMLLGPDSMLWQPMVSA